MEVFEIEDDGLILLLPSVNPDSQSVFLDKRSRKRFKQCQSCGERIYEGEIGFVANSKVSLTCYICREAYFGEIRKSDQPLIIKFPKRMRDNVKYP